MNSIHESKQSTYYPFYFGAIASIFVLAWMLNYSRYGIDFTDESFYLVWAANPFLYEASVSQFGFILHPLYVLLNGDIAHLRQVNVLITYALACVLSYALLTAIAEDILSRTARILASLGFATASLTLFSMWLVTPNYNSLNFQALLVTAIGIVRSASPAYRSQFAGLILIGVGGWLSFMAKPSTALILGLLVIMYWGLSGNLRTRTVLIPIALSCLLLLLSAWAIDGSIAQFAKRISMGFEVGKLIGGGHSIEKLLRLDDFMLTREEKLLLLTALVFPGVCAAALQSENIWYRYLGIIAIILPFSLTVLATLEITPPFTHLGMHQGLLLIFIFGIAMIYIAAALIKRYPIQLSRSHVSLVFFLLLLPYCYAFGTNGNYWWAASFAGFFWLFPGLILLISIRGKLKTSNMVAMLALTVQALSVLLLQTGIQTPYRQPHALTLNNQAVEVGRPGSNLVLSASYAHYLDAATESARAANMTPGSPMIDLSGHSPGILYALQAESLGQAWMIGGYPGSLRLATFTLKSVPCEKLAAAWILAEPNGPRSLPASMLSAFGTDITLHYQQVGSWTTPAGAGGYQQQSEQTLWKPTRSQAVATEECIAARRGDEN